MQKNAVLHEGVAGPANGVLSLAMTPPAGARSGPCNKAKNLAFFSALILSSLVLGSFAGASITGQAISQQTCPSFSLNGEYERWCGDNGGFLLYTKESDGCTKFSPCVVDKTGTAQNRFPDDNSKGELAKKLVAAGEAEASLVAFSISPDPISENLDGKASGEFASEALLATLTCQGPSPCTCAFGEREENLSGRYPFQCRFSKPVNGIYVISAFNIAGRGNSAQINLVPGKSAQVVAASEAPHPVVIAAAALIILSILGYGAFRLFDWIFSDYRKLTKAKKRKEELESDFKMLKYRFMKREVDGPTFKKLWTEKDKEYTEVKSQVDELEKRVEGKDVEAKK